MEGERFFDLVRWGIAKETMNNYFAAEKDNRIYYQNASFDTGEEYFPVPVAQYKLLRRHIHTESRIPLFLIQTLHQPNILR